MEPPKYRPDQFLQDTVENFNNFQNIQHEDEIAKGKNNMTAEGDQNEPKSKKVDHSLIRVTMNKSVVNRNFHKRLYP